MSYEAIVDSRVSRIVEFGHASDLKLKAACLAASTVVGTYSGITGEIAKQTKRSVSSVENWAHAAWLYKALRKETPALAWGLFRSLPASHWWLAYDIQQAGYNALHYLIMANHHGWSGRAMLAEWNKDVQAGNAPLQISRAVIAIRGLADELLRSAQSGSLTDAQIDALMKVQEVFK